jgi:hypothetical protein
MDEAMRRAAALNGQGARVAAAPSNNSLSSVAQVAQVAHDFVRHAQFLAQPQHPLRTRVVEVMHDYHVAL